jgi:hypothetical protein
MQEHAALYLFSVFSAQCSVLSAQCSVLSAQCSVLSAQCSVLSAQCSEWQGNHWRPECTRSARKPARHSFQMSAATTRGKTSQRTLSQTASARRELQSAPRSRQMRGRILFCDPITDLWWPWSGLAGGIDLLLPPGIGLVASCGQTFTGRRWIRVLEQAVGLGRLVSLLPHRP